MRRGPFFFFFFFFFFHFSKPLKFVLGPRFWVYQNGNFVPGKRMLRREKKSGKITLPPLKNIPLTSLTSVFLSIVAIL